MIALRDYQKEAVDAAFSELETHSSTLISACVGAGKTLIQAEIFRQIQYADPRSRILSLAHTRELVSQNAAAMSKVWPGAPIGVNSAALGRRDTKHPILFASIQSVAREPEKLGWFDLVSIDEAHLLPPSAASQYQTFLAALRELNPDLRLVGLSGTPFRLDSGWLHRGKKAMFDSLAYEIGISDLIKKGFLVPPINKATHTTFDISAVHTRGGEYVANELQDAVNDGAVTKAAVTELVAAGRGRRSWIVFCAGVEHAYSVRDAIRAAGVTCETVEGALGAKERAGILASFKAGAIRCLTNVNVLSIGFDHPGIDLLALMRPTKSAGLYIQQVGRGLRCLGQNAEASKRAGKRDVLVLDFAGVVDTLGPVDAPHVSAKQATSDKYEPSPAPQKTCPNCMSKLAIATPVCTTCSFEFPRTSVDDKLTPTASTTPILSDPNGWLPVRDVSYHRHSKFGSETATLRVEYLAGKRSYSEFICFDHAAGTFPRKKAERWWTDRGGADWPPASVDEAVSRTEELAPVGAIRVAKEGEFWRVLSVRDPERARAA